MKDCCDSVCDTDISATRPYRKVLWICLVINAAMFVVEMVSGLAAGSVSLQGNALDFFGDAANYGIALYVLHKTLKARAMGSLVKAATFGLLSLWVLGQSLYKALVLGVPTAEVMGGISVVALLANLFCAVILYKHREGDSNRRSVWICSRNDCIGNIVIMAAAYGVYLTDTRWPDVLVAAILGFLGVSGAYQITRQALTELRSKEESYGT